jgi:hypothetical protein
VVPRGGLERGEGGVSGRWPAGQLVAGVVLELGRRRWTWRKREEALGRSGQMVGSRVIF